MTLKESMGETWNKEFIHAICINKTRILKCISVLLTEKEVIFDAVSMIATCETYSKDDPERCKKDEVVLCKEFPGYSEQLSYITYKKLFMLIETCLKEVITRFEEVDRVEILNELEKAKRKWL